MQPTSETAQRGDATAGQAPTRIAPDAGASLLGTAATTAGFDQLPIAARLIWFAALLATVLLLPYTVAAPPEDLRLPLLLGLFAGGYVLRRLTEVVVPPFYFSYHTVVIPALLVLAGPGPALVFGAGSTVQDIRAEWPDRASRWHEWVFNVVQVVLATELAALLGGLVPDGAWRLVAIVGLWEVILDVLGLVFVAVCLGEAVLAYCWRGWQTHGWFCLQVVLLAVCLVASWHLDVVVGTCALGLLLVEGHLLRGLASNSRAAMLAKQEAQYQADRARGDGLTGLLNRSALEDRLADLVPRGGGVLLLDLDHFKRINDEHGHLTGDVVLQAAARVLPGAVRNHDICGRYGGEEFCVVLPGDMSQVVLLDVAERIRCEIAQLMFAEAPALRVTISVGAATCAPGGDPRAALRAADTALYRAKRHGRNRVELASAADEPRLLDAA